MSTISDKDFKTLAEFIKGNYGIHLKEEKRSLVESRLAEVIRKGNHQNFTNYIDHVFKDPTGEAIELLINKITTNYTYFLREAEHFEYLRSTVLPYLSKAVKDRDLRIWSAGCSTGEEPYTLAMILADFFAGERSLWNTKILATDISTRVLDTATNGTYQQEALANVPSSWKMNYFRNNTAGQCEIAPVIKEEVIFRRFNFMTEVFPFKKKFHVIFCRNVMIYFDSKTKDELVQKFYDFTEPGGYLFIGHSESLNREATSYKYIMPAVYRKI